jgi:hypothetical protein
VPRPIPKNEKNPTHEQRREKKMRNAMAPRQAAAPQALVLVAALLAALSLAPSTASATAINPDYDPTKVDWASVVEACASAIRFERRLGSFALRAAFTDAGSLTAQCAADPTSSPDDGCGGADGSLLISADEQLHKHTIGELYAANTAKFVLPIATKFGSSVADTLQVCALVAPAILSYPAGMAPERQTPRAIRDYIVLRSAVASGFRVGRIDRAPGPGNDPDLLPSETLTARGFTDWFGSRGISLNDAVALMGVHTLLRPKGCYVEDRVNQRTGLPNACIPFAPSSAGAKPIMPSDSGPFIAATGSCPAAAMVRWTNEFYNDVLGTKGEGAAIVTNNPRPALPLRQGQPGFAQQVANAVCGYRSDAFRADAISRHISGSKFVTAPPVQSPTTVDWSCPLSGCRVNPRTWFFTENDAHLSDAARSGAPTANASPSNSEDDAALARDLHAAMARYAGTSSTPAMQQWALDFGKAFARMSALGAKWSAKAFVPTLRECPSGWSHDSAAPTAKNIQMCQRRCAAVVINGVDTSDCPNACVCKSTPVPRVLKVPVGPATGAVTAAS